MRMRQSLVAGLVDRALQRRPTRSGLSSDFLIYHLVNVR
jgi:hypothetical protein